MAITKCPILTPPVNRFIVAARVLSQCGRTSDWMVHAGLLEERIVSKSHSLDYDPLALAVLFLGLGAFGLFVFI
jgi:hypothetical protein